MKSSEVTPLATLKFAELVKEAGFPAVSTWKRLTRGSSFNCFIFIRVLLMLLLVMVILLVTF